MSKFQSVLSLISLFILFNFVLLHQEAFAERLKNEIAVFTALDKVTANIKKLEVQVDQTSEFGSLRVKPFICYTNPTSEAPRTTSFVQIEEVQLDGQLKKIFSGWMFAESPGLNALEHPVFDIWLTGCVRPITSISGDGSPHPNPDKDTAGVFPEEPKQPSPRKQVKP